MVSMACGGTADRIAARIFCKVLRAGSGTPAKYSSTFFGRLWPRAVDLGLPDFILFIPARVGEPCYTFESSAKTAGEVHEHLRRVCSDAFGGRVPDELVYCKPKHAGNRSAKIHFA